MDDATTTPTPEEEDLFFERVRKSNALLARIERNEKQIAGLHAEQAKLLAEYVELNPGKGRLPFSESAPDNLALQVGWTPNVACRRLHHAIELTTRLPRVLGALGSGLVDQRRAGILVDAVEDLPDEVAHTVTDHVLAHAEGRNPTQLRRLVRRAVLRHDPDGGVQRHKTAREKRCVEFHPRPDGMADLYAHLPAHEATVIYQRIDAFARQATSGDGRTVEQRRADAFVDLMLNPALGAVGVTVNLTVPATTISGESDQPGELAGYGPIDAGQARELAGWGRNLTNDRPRVTNGCTRAHGAATSTTPTWKIIADPAWKRMITDPVTGSLVDYDAKTYRPPAAIANLVRARDRYCVFPSCSIPSNSCDLDHRVPYPKGPTTADNLAPLCRGHHRLKHEGGWTLLKNDRGYLWINPAGIEYTKQPEPIAEPTPTPKPVPTIGDQPPF
jgi:hypothetical protein